MKLGKYIKWLKKLILAEREAEVEIMKKEMATISGREREKRGRAVLNLKGKFLKKEFGYKIVKYGREKEILTEIAVGDLVLISRGDPLESNLVGIVVEKGKKYLSVALEKIPSWALFDVRIDLYVNDITFKRQIENLDHLNRIATLALEWSLGKRNVLPPQALSFFPFDKNLNPSQKRAVSFSLGSKDFFLIQGPFGTGKTRVLAEIILQFAQRNLKVLATAESNIAVDNLVERLIGKTEIVRLGHPSRVARNLIESTISFQVENSKKYRRVKILKERVEDLIETREDFLKPTPQAKKGLSDERIIHLAEMQRSKRGIKIEDMESMAEWLKIQRRIKKISQKIESAEEKIAKEIIEKSRVVLCTNSSSSLEILNGVEFDVAVIDEATQATLPSILLPIAKAKFFILAGDHQQLPPTILSEKAKPLSETLFEKLIKIFPQKSILLEVQYRMNEILMEFPNREFYQGKLKADPTVKNITLKDFGIQKPTKRNFWEKIVDPEKVIVFIDTSLCERRFERKRVGSFSKENPFEVEIVKKVLENLLLAGVKKEIIGIITPYDDQLDLLRKELPEDVEINTVDGYQGREKEVILISFVRSSKEKILGFLTDLRRLNVAITRAKRKLICIGDSQTLKTHPTYERFLDFIKRRGQFLTLKSF